MSPLTLALPLTLVLVAQAGPSYRYVETPPVRPGSTLYAHVDQTPTVPICADVFAVGELQKAILAEDRAGIAELRKAGRLFDVTVGTALRVIEYDRGGVVADAPSYEVRVLDGTHRDRKGHTFAVWAKRRIVVPDRPKPKRR